MSLPTLYKMDSSKKIRVWSIITEGNTYSVSHGALGGAQQATLVTCEGKNVGRSNETTAESQAISEAQGLWNKQKDRKGYTVEIPTTQPNLPMLAHKYTDHSKKLKFPLVSCSPKIDGLRLILSVQDGKVTTTSRTGTIFTGLDHITKEYAEFEDVVVDGELYSSTLTFEQISSVVRKGDVNDPRMQSIFFFAFDLINNDPYHTRVVNLEYLVMGFNHTKVVPWFIIKSEDEIQPKHIEFIEQGYEGTMIRNLHSLYQKNKRSYDLLKKKDFLDNEFEVIGYKAGKGKFENVPTFLLRCDGGEFEAVPKGDQSLREDYLRNAESYIGTLATVRFFEYTADGIPRFPVLVAFRPDGI
jgi:DNA ligase-1